MFILTLSLSVGVGIHSLAVVIGGLDDRASAIAGLLACVVKGSRGEDGREGKGSI